MSRARPLEPSDRRGARHGRTDGTDPRLEHPCQDGPDEPDAGGIVRGRARPRAGSVTEPRPASAGIIVAGPPGAPSIIFVHSTRLTGAMWAAQQAELAGEFRTIAVDLPAHGARAAEAFTLDGAADVLAAAIRDHATGGRAVVVGLSLGGYVAMALAAREPALVRGLVLSGATAEPAGAKSLAFLAFASL